MIAGRASAEGTRRFEERSQSAAGHFREAAGTRVSSIGLGTYLGAEDAATDAGYEACVLLALGAGINVFDSAINYRGQKSERAIGRALNAAFGKGLARRDEVFVSTKGGYLPHDAEDPREPRRYILETFVESGLAPRAEMVRGGHCMAPGYLRDQIARSRRNLALETIDLYYLHNVETQRAALGAEAFRVRLRLAIETLEEAIAEGAVASWGVATWDGLRAPPEHPEHLSLAEIEALAVDVAGSGHHFRGVQLPVNLAMPEGIAYASQPGRDGRASALATAARMGLAAFGSASILQGRLAVELPEEIEEALTGVASGAQKALQFARSSPGMTTCLVGVSTPAHAQEDFALAKVPPADPSVVMGLFS